MAWWLFEVVLAAIGLIWVCGSLVITAFRPWRHFERDDRWLAWALMLGWLVIAVAMAIELWIEFRLDRREARRIGQRRQAPDAV
ncbi:MAG: hypothetical protein P0Y59_02655 [Candidatus Sphingomonas phytovorans]|nr:hypothetical protein [Sphingomonas sp.]WEK00612.1 MAG: hypothetical protein P0Y59_02655 [Sphingomonas sp.]